ncbi:DUF599 domain-containing protein [Nitratireductor sp. ZSWI3]|uniref:DUF599 domain-containing protein n=1 Tax=Nitratireductor sp. ZSWI3 TaxID=2966359 RepID=UPI00214F72DB|nr:DUF599 domain-containing protein [Nitratireductor sp. ZSWI3]MCR4267882.1 DUF599 domain-containing protein [Nitratireductor sp. ZSWI3]
MILAASLFPLLCWVFYAVFASWLETRRPSLSVIMGAQRQRWVHNAVRRETPLDAILSGNLMGAVSFFASTTVLIILAVIAVFGQIDAVVEAVSVMQPALGITKAAVERHLVVFLIMFVMAFLSFTLSLRQFNHFCIMLGAADHAEESDPDEVRVMAALNTIAARNFNHGIRVYYFAIGMIAWFVSVWAAVAVTVAVFGAILYREFFSAARNLVAGLKQDVAPTGVRQGRPRRPQ